MFREVIAATLIMTAAATSVAVAGPHGKGGEHRREHLGRALCQLDLGDAQREAIRELMQREREASQGLRQQFRAKRQEYRELKAANDPRAEPVKSELDAMKEQLKGRREALRAEIDKILTPEQRQKLEQLKSKRH